MKITIVIRTESPNVAAAQGIYDSIIARLSNIPNLTLNGKLGEELVNPEPVPNP